MSKDDDALKRIEDKVDKLDSRLDVIDITLTKQGNDLSYHIKRTDILESQISPIRDSYQQLMGVVKFIGFLGLLVSIVVGLSKIFHL